jgi:hypothetical protein
MSTIEETKMYFPLSAPVGSTAVPNEVSLFIAPPPVEIEAKAEAVTKCTLPTDLDLSVLQTLTDEDCLALSADMEPDWTGPDGLMTALLGESPKLCGLELSLNDEVFFFCESRHCHVCSPGKLPWQLLVSSSPTLTK